MQSRELGRARRIVTAFALLLLLCTFLRAVCAQGGGGVGPVKQHMRKALGYGGNALP